MPTDTCHVCTNVIPATEGNRCQECGRCTCEHCQGPDGLCWDCDEEGDDD